MVIRSRMGFNDVEDFNARKKIIKGEYEGLNRSEKEIYKMYVYAKREIEISQVNMIWEYINAADRLEEKEIEIRMKKESER